MTADVERTPGRPGRSTSATWNPEPSLPDLVASAVAAELLPVLAELHELRRQVAALTPATTAARLLSTTEKATELGRSAEWVRDHRSELGALTVGDGPRPRLLFPPGPLPACCTGRTSRGADEPAAPTDLPARTRRSARSGTQWRPIHADEEARRAA